MHEVVRRALSPVALGLALTAACRGEGDAEVRPASGVRSYSPASAATANGCSPIDPSEGVRGAFIGNRFGPLALFESSAEGQESPLSSDDLRGRCDGKGPRLLVVRLDAPWCAPCNASAERYAGVVSSFDAVLSLDIVFSGTDNGPTNADDLAGWKREHRGLPGRVARAADATASDLLRFQRVAPAVFLVEPGSMRILDVLAAPTSDKLYGRIAKALGSLGVTVAVGARAAEPLVDGRFTPEDWAVLTAMKSGAPPPDDPSNAYDGDPRAQELGGLLFSDAELGGRHSVACAACHTPSLAFTDGRPTARAVGTSDLNTLGLGAAAYTRWFFWDGRADSLWAQATGPIENPREMDGTRLGVAHRIAAHYRQRYESIFGPLPDLADTSRFPASGRPGEPSYDGLEASDREAVTRVFVNAAKALAAYESTLRPMKSRFDAYLAGDRGALSARERDGAKVFLDAGCAVCHGGPMLTDGAFHDIHMPSASLDGPAFQGRVDGVKKLLASEFRSDGPWADAHDSSRERGLSPSDSMLAQVRTPTLRDLVRTAPYGHGGTFKTLDDVVAHYDMEELTDTGPTRIGTLDPAVAAFAATDEQRQALVAFLRAVGGG